VPLEGLLACVAILFAAAPTGVLLARRPFGTPLIYGLCLAASLALLAGALLHLLAGAAPLALALPLGLPWVGAHFRLDLLSAAFLVIVNLGTAGASLYGIGYGRHEAAPQRVLPFFPVFLAGMNLVVLADDAFTFLVAWEFMSLASWALVLTQHRAADNRHAAYVYIVMASFGTLSLLLAFGLLAGATGGYDFAAIRAAPPSALLGAGVLGLVLLGAGSKAGLVPLHVWLPLAHPAAPSHVSALMSGVMTKVAVYGFIRITFDLLGPPDWWWGMAVLVIGGCTAVLGVLYALFQTDLKRVLAYSTIENIGFVFVGLGLAMAFRANGMGSAAALALTAALFHVLNHSLFKSLLFYGAGAVLSGSGLRDMDRLGGLIRRMPVTAAAFLVGAVAIAGLPPFNGFASEWLLLQSILLSPELPQWGLKLAVPATGCLLVLAAALAAACFVRAFGVTFLGRPRSAAAAEAHEADRWSLAAMSLCALLCLVFGVLPGLALDSLAPAVQGLIGSRMPAQLSLPWLSSVPIAESRSSYNGLLVFGFILLSTTMAVLAIHRLASRALRRGPAWDCGFPEPSPATQYSGASFSQPIRRVLGAPLFRAREALDLPPPGELRPARLVVTLKDLVWDALYAPLGGLVGRTAERLNRLQFLTIRRYLALVFATLVILLLVLAIWG